VAHRDLTLVIALQRFGVSTHTRMNGLPHGYGRAFLYPLKKIST
jgi:hypothetical protein